MIRVLIVDDSPTSAQLLNELFLAAGDFEVVGCATSGSEALTLCARLQPDIVSMDVLMKVCKALQCNIGDVMDLTEIDE